MKRLWVLLFVAGCSERVCTPEDGTVIGSNRVSAWMCGTENMVTLKFPDGTVENRCFIAAVDDKITIQRCKSD